MTENGTKTYSQVGDSEDTLKSISDSFNKQIYSLTGSAEAASMKIKNKVYIENLVIGGRQ